MDTKILVINRSRIVRDSIVPALEACDSLTVVSAYPSLHKGLEVLARLEPEAVVIDVTDFDHGRSMSAIHHTIPKSIIVVSGISLAEESLIISCARVRQSIHRHDANRSSSIRGDEGYLNIADIRVRWAGLQ